MLSNVVLVSPGRGDDLHIMMPDLNIMIRFDSGPSRHYHAVKGRTAFLLALDGRPIMLRCSLYVPDDTHPLFFHTEDTATKLRA